MTEYKFYLNIKTKAKQNQCSTTQGIKISSKQLKTLPMTRREREDVLRDILRPLTSQPKSTPDEDKSRAISSTSFQEVINIRVAISSKLNGVLPDPTIKHSADKSSTTCHLLQKVSCHRCSSNRRLLISFRHTYSRSKSSPPDFIPTYLLQKCF